MYEKRIAPKGAVRRFVPIWLNQGQNIFVAIDHQLAIAGICGVG
ncbi:hypothetical protein [Allomesorhizobium camelthorni]|nr:hypothetical protein [Mesorhizobium camelthorni]